MQSLAASPTMVGAITTLIVIVAVFLAYNANQGLPFVPVYRVSVEVPNAARLVSQNEVRIGGHRVGVVESIEIVQPTADEATDPAATDSERAGGASADEVLARLNLKLDKTAQPLPTDSVFRIRYRSSFGLKYLEITRGDGEAAPEGYVFDNPENFIVQTEFDDINNTFDSETRENSRTNLVGFGDALAGRGTSLNLAFEQLDPLFRDLRPVARVLADRDTRLGRFVRELADSARIVAPVAETQAQLFTNMAITFAAISEDVSALQETISEGPATLETGIRTLPRQRPFLRDFTRLSRELAPGISDLRPTLPVLNEAIDVGTPVLRRTPQLNDQLRRTFLTLDDLLGRPSTGLALERLGETFTELESVARFAAPAQTVCNYFNYWFTFISESLSDRDQVGFAHRESLIGSPRGSTEVALGPEPPLDRVRIPGEQEAGYGGYAGTQSAAKDAVTGVFKPYELAIVAAEPYGPAGQRDADCQAGQNGYPIGSGVPGDPDGLRLPGQRLGNPTVAVSDLPGSRGPTTVFFDENGDRVLRDSRVPSRAPETWRK